MTKASALMDWENEDARDVVQTARSFFLGKVADEVLAIFVVLGHDIEKKWLDVVVECLTSQEQLRQQAQVLTINGILAAIDLEE